MAFKNYFTNQSPTDFMELHIPLWDFVQVKRLWEMLTLAKFRPFQLRLHESNQWLW